MHSALGLSGQTPMGPPGIVQALPDDYITKDPERFGIISAVIVAGGAGTRSEILLLMVSLSESYGVEISNIWFALTTTNGLEIVRPTATVSGLTELLHYSTDVPANSLISSKPLGIYRKNTAAATAGTRVTGSTIIEPVANQWTRVPGRIILRSGPGLPGQLMLRPDADNVELRLIAEWRLLEKRQP